MPCLEAQPESWQTEGAGGLGGTTFAMLASRFAFPAGPLRGASSALPSASVVSSDFCGAKASPQSRWQETSACRLSAQFQQAAEGVFDEAVRATGARCDADAEFCSVGQPILRDNFSFSVQVEMPDFIR